MAVKCQVKEKKHELYHRKKAKYTIAQRKYCECYILDLIICRVNISLRGQKKCNTV